MLFRSHFDHSGGLATFAAEGATIVTNAANKAFYERGLSAKREVNPDALARSKKKAKVQGVGEKFSMTDGNRTIEMHQLKGNDHHESIMMVYLPKEKLLVQADVFAPLPAGAKPPATPNPVFANFADNVSRLKLSVDRIVGIHGGVAPIAELNRALCR